jgi:two-component system OmpR family sensor kinase
VSSFRERYGGLPLRVKLVAAVLALVALGLLITGVTATTVVQRYLLKQVDENLAGASRSVAALSQQGRRGGSVQIDQLSRYYVLVLDPNGTPTDDPLRPGDPDPEPDPDLPTQLPTGTPFTTGAVAGDGRWRVLVAQVPNGYSVVFGAPLEETDAAAKRLVLVEALVSLAVLAVLAGAGYAVVRTSLRPLQEVEQTAAAIAGGDLSLRVPRQDDRTEVGRLALAFNSMLGRIEESFRAQRESEAAARESEARMRRFVADASHELRTPLTSIRGFAELYRQGAVPPGQDLDRVMGRVEGEASRMGQLVEEMLLLARLDQQRPLDTAPVDLLQLAADAVHDAQAVDPARSIRLEVAEDGDTPVVLGDEARLRQVLVNLLGNAVTHTPPATPVVVRLRTEQRCAVVEVEDRGPGLTAEQAAKVFERFYRADTARTRASGGNGLGLSIVRAVVEAHGGRVGVRSTVGQGATFLVELPLASQLPL